jgi:hypothetical protein
MVVYLNRMSGADKRYKNVACTFFLNSDRTFTIYPVAEKFDQIILGNEKPNTIPKIRGIVNKFWLGNEGMSLEECFVEIDGQWYKDGFLLWWREQA